MKEKREGAMAKGQSDFKELSYSRMIFSGVGHMILLIGAFWLHWSLGVLYLIFWLFILPFLELKRLQQRERENPLPKPSKEAVYDDSPLFEDEWDREDQAWKEEWDEGWNQNTSSTEERPKE